ncbi:MAG TPA: two-component regulator propeller domain-containing protein [Chryseolinea sp.]
MNRLNFLFPSLILVFVAITTAAQLHDTKFKLISGANGVSIGKINGITRDPHGVMWFADQTNGCITRYDGNLMTQYHYDPRNLNSPGGTYPECILADSSGIIWIGYYGMGLDRFDPETNTYTHYRHLPGNSQSLSNDSITAILIDHTGKLWIGTNGGLDMWDPATGKFTQYQHQPSDPTSLSHNVIRSLFEDSDGTLWIGTGLAWASNNNGGLNRFNRDQKEFTRFLHDPKNTNSLLDNKVRAIFEDSRRNLWVGTKRNGLHIIDKKTGTVKRISVSPDDKNALFKAPVMTPYDHFTFINEDVTGSLWFGTLSDGLFRYNPITKESTHFSRNNNRSSGFKDYSGWCSYSAPDGLMWVSTQEANLYQIDLYTNIIDADSLNMIVIDMIEESPSVRWMGTTEGLVRQDLNEGSVQRFRHDPKNENSLSHDVVISVLKASDGMLWLGTQIGLNNFDPTTRKFTRYYIDPNVKATLTANDIQKVYEDKDQNLWLGSFGGGLIKMGKDSKIISRYLTNPSDTTSIRGDYVNAIVQDQDNSMWVGSVQGGLNRLNTATGKFQHYLTGITVNSIHKDASAKIWICTDLGLYLYNRDNDTFFLVKEVSENLQGERILAVSEDNKNNLWIVSNITIYCLNENTRNVIRFDEDNGIDKDMLLGNVIKLQNGHMLFSTRIGYYEIDPEKLVIPLAVPKIHFKSISINGELLKSGEEILKEPLSVIKELKLSHDQNVFSIDFDAVDYGEPREKMVYYMLDGYDNEWRRLSATNQVYFFNIPPGKYKFLVKAANTNNGVWVEENISITISPPWWSTIWAYALYSVAFAATVYAVHRLQKDRLVKIEREKAHERELVQAREIERAYSSLKETQAQLIQSEKMASLGELTAGIAHEIQNPLNFVNNFSEVNKELLDELKTEIENGNLEGIKAIANDVISNEEKISHHGKRADAIVKGMLQHSRSSSGQKEPTDINALCEEYLRLAYHGLRAKDKSFNALMKTDFDATIKTINIIPQDIGRVMLNLVNNAFHAVAEKKRYQRDNYEPTVSVTTSRSGDKVLISVKDNGNGISQAILDKVFQPFFTTKPTGQGTGLGLSISYDIVKAHGGELSVKTREGEGSEFTISLRP